MEMTPQQSAHLDFSIGETAINNAKKDTNGERCQFALYSKLGVNLTISRCESGDLSGMLWGHFPNIGQDVIKASSIYLRSR